MGDRLRAMTAPNRTRRAVGWALVGYALLLGLALLAPTSGTQSHMASWVVDLSHALGVPERLATQPRAEFLCNALILAPLTALAALWWPRTSWRDWTAGSFVLALGVEVLQGVLLPARTASYADVVANTLGGLGGAVLVAVLRRAGLAGSAPGERGQELDR
jgi:glycopeptide antibiotics resistance protein